MTEQNLAPNELLVELGDAHRSIELGSGGERNLQSQLLDRRMTSNETVRKINAVVAPLSTQSEALIQSVMELTERSFIRSTDGNQMSD